MSRPAADWVGVPSPTSIADPTRALERISRLRIGFFGTFFPEYQKAGNSSTGIVFLLRSSDLTGAIEVFSQVGSYFPEDFDTSNLRNRPVWKFDSPISLLRCLRLMRNEAQGLDAYVFNIYMTSFGRTRITNAVGLLIPPLLRLVTGKPVLVYMHNFLETQDFQGLGYQPSFITRGLVRSLEWILLNSTTVVVPLRSQARAISSAFGRHVRHILLPCLESIYYASRQLEALRSPRREASTRRILCLGNWGPQKDLDGALSAISRVCESETSVSVSIAGTANSNFPEYLTKLRDWRTRLAGGRIIFLGPVTEQQAVELLSCHDVLLLPYTSTGGYSGAMNASALTGIRLVAYDLPQLRETAAELGLDCTFVKPGDVSTLALALTNELRKAPVPEDALKARQERLIRRSRQSVDDLIHLGIPPERRNRRDLPTRIDALNLRSPDDETASTRRTRN